MFYLRHSGQSRSCLITDVVTAAAEGGVWVIAFATQVRQNGQFVLLLHLPLCVKSHIIYCVLMDRQEARWVQGVGKQEKKTLLRSYSAAVSSALFFRFHHLNECILHGHNPPPPPPPNCLMNRLFTVAGWGEYQYYIRLKLCFTLILKSLFVDSREN